ncbi:tail fiber assembly protein [Enterobacter cloacae]|uniref:tail fiber assembly protein n=1 Tax=Enterobacter cloacae TaxID=550 RepID=UPI002B1D43D0|nr:tail fiber assembly protein [Enterobacter cloacae]MEA3725902.1 tail fiber assembly protein [Enterobacter cloacae]MEA3730819.1 tail fiber assembly protein [Enterobacter cloacae]MEA3740141.1 tail fiber assembly protein [Enterobacter cloacae]MEA3754032.1 tail fiber assembly protein [Enterobacter cloacae]MEA3768108.1 tail fiber assembly protein [Enterobacter cloacae]
MQVYNGDTGTYVISGNNTYAWSAQKNSFYLISDLLAYIRNDNWPQDAVEVSDDVFTEFAPFQRGDGKIRGAGDDGLPAWVNAPEPAKEDLLRSAEARRGTLIAKASLEIEMLADAEADNSITDHERELLAQWKAYRLALRRLDLSPVPDITWPEVPGDVA